jgi:hypothetical protein
LEQALFGLPDEGRRTRNPAASNGGVLFFTPHAKILRSAIRITDDRMMAAPAAPMMGAQTGLSPENYDSG